MSIVERIAFLVDHPTPMWVDELNRTYPKLAAALSDVACMVEDITDSRHKWITGVAVSAADNRRGIEHAYMSFFPSVTSVRNRRLVPTWDGYCYTCAGRNRYLPLDAEPDFSPNITSTFGSSFLAMMCAGGKHLMEHHAAAKRGLDVKMTFDVSKDRRGLQ